MAGAEGIEPSPEALEAPVLPLNYAPGSNLTADQPVHYPKILLQIKLFQLSEKQYPKGNEKQNYRKSASDRDGVWIAGLSTDQFGLFDVCPIGHLSIF